MRRSATHGHTEKPELILQIDNPSEKIQSEVIRKLYKEELTIDFSQDINEKSID